MAHFAKLKSQTDPTGFTSDTHLVVETIVVIANDVPTEAGPLGDNDMHVDGETYCQNLFKGGTWKQTSYNSNFRKHYAGIGHVYNETKNKFLTPQFFASWSLAASDDWQAPITFPTIKDDQANPSIWFYLIDWDEAAYQADNTKGWKATKSNDTSESPTIYDWNGTAWV
tara:strand:+ start:989 stop:1495 length:507 start_codon:yes stop_codon:yes gene_type:complete